MKKSLFLIAIVAFSSCAILTIGRDRNKIEFTAPVADVKDSIRVMTPLLEKIPWMYGFTYYEYSSKDDELIMNTHTIGRISELTTQNDFSKAQDLKFLNNDEAKRFINLILFFKQNKITSAFKDISINKYIYEYKEFDRGGVFDNTRRYMRYIALVNSEKDTMQECLKSHYKKGEIKTWLQQYKIYDARDSLVLIGPLL